MSANLRGAGTQGHVKWPDHLSLALATHDCSKWDTIHCPKSTLEKVMSSSISLPCSPKARTKVISSNLRATYSRAGRVNMDGARQLTLCQCAPPGCTPPEGTES